MNTRFVRVQQALPRDPEGFSYKILVGHSPSHPPLTWSAPLTPSLISESFGRNPFRPTLAATLEFFPKIFDTAW